MELFAVRNLSFFYPKQQKPALNDLNLDVRPGEFLVLCGPSGCGKSTLLRHFKSALTPCGVRTGEIFFKGKPLGDVPLREQTCGIGFVQQSPENQLVTDKVWHELAFGLESLGYDTPAIRSRVAEIASFFGMESWFYRNVSELSGGQKQLLNLASILVMQPSVLVLDEPAGQLDPIAASEFLGILGKINRELGTAVVLTEHRLEEAIPMAHRVVVMEQGKILCEGKPAEIGGSLRKNGHSMFRAMPAAMRIWDGADGEGACPVTVKEGRDWMRDYAEHHKLLPLPGKAVPAESDTVLSAEGLRFRYEKDGADVVRDFSLSLHKGEFLALLGGNGTGKSTCLKLLAGLLQPLDGTVQRDRKAILLPQDPKLLFVKKTVREDLQEVLKRECVSEDERMEKLKKAAVFCGLEELLDRHPYDLSGGEQQRAALAKVLLFEPEILLLDEPTKGLDADFKQELGEMLEALLREGKTVLMVSHDVEFCAGYAHTCALFFDGAVVSQGEPRTFFSGNRFYTTAAARIGGDRIPGAVTAEDVIKACGGNLPHFEKPQTYKDISSEKKSREQQPETEAEMQKESGSSSGGKLPLWRKCIAASAACVCMVLFFFAVKKADLNALFSGAEGKLLDSNDLCFYGIFTAALIVLAWAVSRRDKTAAVRLQTVKAERRLPGRTKAAAAAVLLSAPVTLFVGSCYLDNQRYYFIALLILLECMAPFFLIFEGRKPQARELVILAVLCGFAVAGRAALFMLPQFKPVMAVVIISGAALGGEAGFLVGALSMLLSNMLFSQGPWMPWQMFAMGLIGFLSGVLFQKGLLARSRGALCTFGALCALIIYGGIMNPASALIWAHTLSKELVLTYYLAGFPMDLMHAVSTALFLWFAAEPMLEKLERVKTKYGLAEKKESA